MLEGIKKFFLTTDKPEIKDTIEKLRHEMDDLRANIVDLIKLLNNQAARIKLHDEMIMKLTKLKEISK